MVSGVERVTLPGTDLSVSRVCLGALPFGSETDETTSLRMIDLAFGAGINFIDTANVYGEGASERVVGKALRDRREEVVVATKVRGRTGDRADQNGLSAAAIRRALDESLRRLRTDYVDICYLHAPDHSVSIEESLAALDEAVRAGKVRYPASSNYSSWEVCEMLWIAEREGYCPATITQPMYNLVARGIEQEYLPMARRCRVATIVYNPLAGGLLTGKHQRERPLEGTRFSTRNPLSRIYLDRYWHAGVFDSVDALARVAAEVGCSLVELSFSWLLHHTTVDGLILGASHIEQLEQNLRALDVGPMPAEAVASCDRIWQTLRGVVATYNR
jgi:aryl-alcohol dehydrogenase-like predicted oxidoreductase